MLEQIGTARCQQPCGEATLLRGDPPELPRLLAEQAQGFLRRHQHARPELQVHPAGSVDLILLSLPAVLLYGREGHSNRWHQPFSAFDVLTAAAIVLRPGGFLACISKSAELEGTPRDLGGETVPLCTELGLAYWQHVIALLVPIEDGQLKPRRPRRRRRCGDAPAPLRLAHADVHVFRKPTSPPGRSARDLELEEIEQWWR
ncbi:MAG: hypothetical protein KGJ43_00145 [Acidobacteriota bacterium]|nr:hypothetical protein [Acidobacteriota bacterium]